MKAKTWQLFQSSILSLVSAVINTALYHVIIVFWKLIILLVFLAKFHKLIGWKDLVHFSKDTRKIVFSRLLIYSKIMYYFIELGFMIFCYWFPFPFLKINEWYFLLILFSFVLAKIYKGISQTIIKICFLMNSGL